MNAPTRPLAQCLAKLLVQPLARPLVQPLALLGHVEAVDDEDP